MNNKKLLSCMFRSKANGYIYCNKSPPSGPYYCALIDRQQILEYHCPLGLKPSDTNPCGIAYNVKLNACCVNCNLSVDCTKAITSIKPICNELIPKWAIKAIIKPFQRIGFDVKNARCNLPRDHPIHNGRGHLIKTPQGGKIEWSYERPETVAVSSHNGTQRNIVAAGSYAGRGTRRAPKSGVLCGTPPKATYAQAYRMITQTGKQEVLEKWVTEKKTP